MYIDVYRRSAFSGAAGWQLLFDGKQKEAEALAMEAQESAVLASLGFFDPYRRRGV